MVNFSWVHTFNSKLLLTVSPFYHYNRANYDSPPTDDPAATTQDRGSTYAGGQVSFSANVAKNNLQAGVYSFYQHDNELFGAHLQRRQRQPAVFRTTETPLPAAWRHSSLTTNSRSLPG